MFVFVFVFVFFVCNCVYDDVFFVCDDVGIESDEVSIERCVRLSYGTMVD